jgi:peptidoglycan hydrolase-like protein with peptidoglycan-binding domain
VASESGRARNWIVGGAVVLVLLGGGWLWLSTHAHRPPPPPAAAQVGTATVVRTDLANTQALAGTLGFGTPSPVTGKGTGVITELPTAGTTITRGQALYRADDQPVVLFYGDSPLFRTLAVPPAGSPALTGSDVTVVAQNLRALGYAIGYEPRTGAVYTPTLAAAVKRWQQDVGTQPTGTLGVEQVVVFAGAERVGTVSARLGDPVTETVLTVTPTAKIVTVPVPATGLAGITVGVAVTIALPDGTPIPGSVTAISQSVQASVNQQANQPQDPNNPTSAPTVNVSVTPSRATDVASLVSAPVRVTFTTSVRTGVLAVPVTALLALRGGGYALQRTNGVLIAVHTGLFASGMVEVSGAGVMPGLRVQTAA